MPISIDRSIVYAKCLLLFLVSTQILVGVALLIVSEYFKHTLLKHLPVAELSIEMHVICIQFYGVHIIVHYVFGYPLVRRCMRPSSLHDKDIVVLLIRMWHVFVVLVSLDGGLVYWMWSRSEGGLTDAVEEVMWKGVDRYYADPVWRLHWDEYQVGDQCCGVRGYRDWLSREWQDVQDAKLPSGQILEQQTVSSVPYSCCKPDSFCYVDKVPGHIQTWTEMQNVNLGSINQNGCLDVFAANFKMYAKLLGGIVIVVIVVQIIILILIRFMRIATQIPLTLMYSSSVDRQSQTEIPTGQPLSQSTADPTKNYVVLPTSSHYESPFNSNDDSVHIIYENETTTTANQTDVLANRQRCWSSGGIGNSCGGGGGTEIEEIVMQKRVGKEYYKVREKLRGVRYSALRNEEQADWDNVYGEGDRQPLLDGHRPS